MSKRIQLQEMWDEYCDKCDTFYRAYEGGGFDPCKCFPEKECVPLDELYDELLEKYKHLQGSYREKRNSKLRRGNN